MQRAPDAPLVARYSRVKLLAWLLVTGALPALSLVLLSGGVSPVSALVLVACSLVFLFPFAVLFAKLFDRRAQVRIDQDGILVRSHSPKTIPLRSLSGLARRGGRMIMGLTKPEKYPIKNPIRQMIWKANGAQAPAFFGHVWIWTAMLDCSYVEMHNAIHDFRPVTDYERELRAQGASARTDIAPCRL